MDGGEGVAGGVVLPAENGVVAFARERLGIEPDAKQCAFLASEAKEGILNCSRQWGKSTMAAVKAVHRAMTRPGSLVVVASPTEAQSAEMVMKARGMCRDMNVRVKGDGTGRPSVVLKNGSRILGLPGKAASTRGPSSVSMLILDEASRMEDSLYLALLPTLAVGEGELWLLSTPCGRRGFFYEAWALGGEEWERHWVPATECPRISAAFLEKQRRKMPPQWFQQEFMGEFVDNGTEVFDRGLVEAAFREDVADLGVGVRYGF